MYSSIFAICMSNHLSFKCEQNIDDAAMVTPCIDGISLVDLVAAFERDTGYDDPAGGYAGIVPSHFRLGPLPSYFLGREEPVDGGEQGEIYALFCECGEAGCWPLAVHVRINENGVVWEKFAQPHRPNRDYSKFGPFEFNKAEYDQVVTKAELFCE